MKALEIIFKYFLILTTCALVILSAYAIYTYANDREYHFVRGYYGKHCYPIEDYHGNIRFLVKFKTLQECADSIHE